MKTPTRRIGTILFVLALLPAVGCPRITLPKRYVLAYAPTYGDATPETRVSSNGTLWGDRVLLRDATNGTTPVLNPRTVPPGIGSNGQEYLLAWFDETSTLHTRTSGGGLVWVDDQTHGTFDVDPLSRPAVAFNFNDRAWYVAVRETLDRVQVLQVRPTTGQSALLPSVVTDLPPAMTYFDGKLFLAFAARENPVIVKMLTSTDGTNWPVNGGAVVQSGGAPITTISAPYLSSTAGNFALIVTRWVQTTPELSHGQIHQFISSDGLTWNSERVLLPASSLATGPAITGPGSAVVVAAESAGSAATDVWFDGQRVRTLPTDSTGNLSLAMGPDRDLVISPLLNFRSIDRSQCGPQSGWSQNEEVTVEAEHFRSDGTLLNAMTPWTAHIDDPASFNNSLADSAQRTPSFLFQMQQTEFVTVKVTNDDMTFEETLNFTDFPTCTVEFRDQSVCYTLTLQLACATP